MVNDPRVTRVPVGCGNCMECRKQKARGWQVRLLEDIRTNMNGKFITLTFSNEKYRELNSEIDTGIKGYSRDNAIATLAVRRFLERWRKANRRSVRHWLVTELGHKGTENIHLHGIIWTDNNINDIEKHWGYGFVWKGYYKNGKLQNYVNEKTVNYIIKYVSKMDMHHKTYKGTVLTSPGIGRNYTARGDSKSNKYNGNETKETYRTRSGHKVAMPNYWRNKIYTDDEREKLWIQKLDKEERWVNGIKVDISKGEQLYWKILKQEREQNKQLGYGTDNNWKRAEYEHQRRIIIQNKRLTETPPAGFKQKDLDIEGTREEPREQPDNKSAITKAYKNKFGK